ncbi:hypothetical protein D3C84_922840 [compost metagenome]
MSTITDTPVSLAYGPVIVALSNWTRIHSKLSSKSIASVSGLNTVSPSLSITDGIIRPPLPSLTGAGSGLPDETTVRALAVISVAVNCEASGVYSFTVPATVT